MVSMALSMLKLDFYNKTRVDVSKNIFSQLLSNVEKWLVKDKIIKCRRSFLIELTLVGNEFIKKLNKACFRKNRPTDVISLSYFCKEENQSFAGEIFICAEFARRQAKRLGHSLTKELQFLFIHGLLHIFGCDHKKPRETKRMEMLTRRILGHKIL